MITDAPTLEDAVSRLFGRGVSVHASRNLGGGCINRASAVTLSDGTVVLVKENAGTPRDLFETEARGLQVLHDAPGPRVPRPLACHAGEDGQFLITEYVSSGARRPNFFEIFGRQLATMHRETTWSGFGFDTDNYLGATRQVNSPTTSWIEFFRDHRLGYQIDLAEGLGHANRTMSRAVRGVMERLNDLILEPDKPALLHGDLWAGNYMVGEAGEPVIIDPAVYYGHPEADLAMTELFGGFSPPFYDACMEGNPLEPGYATRKEVYNLYHMLNHLNIFGSGYAGSVMAIAERFVR